MKQKEIPYVKTPEFIKQMTGVQLRKYILRYLKDNFCGKTIYNEDRHIPIIVPISSANKTAYGEAIYSKKIVSLLILDKLLKNAVYNNFGNKKPSDAKNIIGYYNFKCFCIIDNKKECLRIAVRVQTDGKFYYNLEVNKKTNA